MSQERYYDGVKEVRVVDEVDAVNANLAQGWEILRITDQGGLKLEYKATGELIGSAPTSKPLFILGLRYVTGEPFKQPAEPTGTERGQGPTFCKYCKTAGKEVEIRFEHAGYRDDGRARWDVYEAATGKKHDCPNRPRR